jgi:hypothetical protein
MVWCSGTGIPVKMISISSLFATASISETLSVCLRAAALECGHVEARAPR